MDVYRLLAYFACCVVYFECFLQEADSAESEEVYLDILRVLSEKQGNDAYAHNFIDNAQQGERTLRQADRCRVPVKRRVPMRNRLCLCPPCPECVVVTQTAEPEEPTTTAAEETTAPEETTTTASESASTTEQATTERTRHDVKQEIAQLRKEIQIRLKSLDRDRHPQLPPTDGCPHRGPPRDPERIPPQRIPPRTHPGRPPPPGPHALGRTPPPRMPPRTPPSRRPPPRRPPRPPSPFKPLGSLIDFVRRVKTFGKGVVKNIMDPLGLNPLFSRESRQSRLSRSSMEDDGVPDWGDSDLKSLPSNYKQVELDDGLSISVLTD